ncbi:MAG TPA: hypothetical protein VEL09_14255 [Burkholderiales bacterium]|nr:hypothetical protein [Burkholderiales bacterium]
MLYKTNFFDVTYEAKFRAPLFVLAGTPVVILEAVHGRLSPKYALAPSDLVVDSGRSVGDVHSRINLFAGNGSLDIRADVFTAKFTNPNAPGDLDTIEDCIQLTIEALATVGGSKFAVQEEILGGRMFIELLDSSTNVTELLRGLFNRSDLFAAPAGKRHAEAIPGFHIEFVENEEKWTFNFDLTRAIRSSKELFFSTSTQFREGGAFSALKEKIEHAVNLTKEVLKRAGLEPQKQPQPSSKS